MQDMPDFEIRQALNVDNTTGDAGWFCGDTLNNWIKSEVGEFNPGMTMFYMLRRFSFPLHGCDPYKEIAHWILETPHQDIFLGVSPKPSRVSFYFLAKLKFLNKLKRDDVSEKFILSHLISSAVELKKPISIQDVWFTPFDVGDHVLDGIKRGSDGSMIGVAMPF